MKHESQLTKLCKQLKIAATAQETHAPLGYRGSSEGRHYVVWLTMGTKKLTTPFHQGSAHTKPPTAADVLYCLVSDADAGLESFRDFCGNFGHDMDSRHALDLYLTCQETYTELRAFLGSDNFAVLREASRDH